MDNHYQPAGMTSADAEKVSDILQQRLNSLVDLGLTLKHIHWNVIGPGFIGVHEMLDEHVEGVRLMSDEVAERIATLGGVPSGLPGYIVDNREWDDYAIGRAVVAGHLGALNRVYDGVIGDHRGAIEATEPIDPVTEDMLTGQTGKLELYQWFVRAHIENTAGELPGSDEDSELDAAAAAATADHL